MVLFQSSSVILCSIHCSLKQFLAAFKDLYIQANLDKKILKEALQKTMNFDLHT